MSDLIRQQTGERIRFFLLRTHYRSTILYGEEGLEEAGTSLETFYRFFDRFDEIMAGAELSFYSLDVAKTRSEGDFNPGEDKLLKDIHAIREKFLASMDDDFNTGAAISQLFDSIKILNRYADSHSLSKTSDGSSQETLSLRTAATVIKELAGTLGLFQKKVPTTGGNTDDAERLDQVVQLLIQLRKEARENKDYAMGDAIRDRLGELGIALLDKKEGTRWERS